MGYNKTFSSFEEAQRYADRYRLSSHEHPMNVKSHLSFNLRLSDYAVIFHLKCLRDEIGSVLDIGGSAGNLFYCYDKYLHYGPDFSWIVNDVPQNNAAGRRIANERGEPRLRFVDDLAECRRVDAVLISGALHYFDVLPPELMSNLNPPPRHVFINRTPVIDGQSAITVRRFRLVACDSPCQDSFEREAAEGDGRGELRIGGCLGDPGSAVSHSTSS